MARLKSISEQLAQMETQTVTDLFEIVADPEHKIKKEKVFATLLKLAKTDSKVEELITYYGADAKIMRKVYDQLISHGAGRFTRGYWVPAASLTDPHTLEALFRNFVGEKFMISGYTDYNAGVKMAYRMFNYFTENENTPIEDL